MASQIERLNEKGSKFSDLGGKHLYGWPGQLNGLFLWSLSKVPESGEGNEDDINGYQIMDSGSSDASSSSLGLDISIPSFEDIDMEILGHEIIQEVAKINCEGLEAIASNDFLENVTTTQE
ncbi:hypothetical protein M5K25_010871 [Dendrobium thyrsiflorum]|uniref:Uncharacterized protein n=1 Tax=Dendrobium thyrsiflorum TaxID=117978 RepID=A0ABD0V216_DENTH